MIITAWQKPFRNFILKHQDHSSLSRHLCKTTMPRSGIYALPEITLCLLSRLLVIISEFIDGPGLLSSSVGMTCQRFAASIIEITLSRWFYPPESTS